MCAAEPINDAVDSPPALNSVIIIVSAATSPNSSGSTGRREVAQQVVLRIGGGPLEMFVDVAATVPSRQRLPRRVHPGRQVLRPLECSRSPTAPTGRCRRRAHRSAVRRSSSAVGWPSPPSIRRCRPVTPSSHNRSAVSPMNGSSALIRLAANCGTNNFRCAAWAGSSAVARAWMSPPSSPIGKVPTSPPWYVIVAVRFDEKSCRSGDDLVDRVPGTHGVETGITDRVDRAARQHPVVQGIRILNELVVEQLETELAFAHRHSSRLRCGRRRVNGRGLG